MEMLKLHLEDHYKKQIEIIKSLNLDEINRINKHHNEQISYLKKRAIIELKNYYMQLVSTYDKKVITLGEGKDFIRNYIVKTLTASDNDMLDAVLFENMFTLAGTKPKFLRDNFKHPVLTTYKAFEKSFLPETPPNPRIAHFKEFRTFYNIQDIRNIKKVVDIEEIEARMDALNDESNDKRFK